MPSKNCHYEDFGHLKYVEFEIGTGLPLYELLQIVFPRCLFCIEIDLRDSSFLLSEISTIDFAVILTHPFEKLFAMTLHWLGNDLRDSKRLWKLK